MDNNFVYLVSMDGAYNAKIPTLNTITIIGVFDNEYDANKAVHNVLVEYPGMNREAIRVDPVYLNKQHNIEREPNNNTYFGDINLIF